MTAAIVVAVTRRYAPNGRSMLALSAPRNVLASHDDEPSALVPYGILDRSSACTSTSVPNIDSEGGRSISSENRLACASSAGMVGSNAPEIVPAFTRSGDCHSYDAVNRERIPLPAT